MAELSRLAINQATTRPQWSLAECIAGYAAQGVRGIGVWRDKLEELGAATASKMLADHGMTVTGCAAPACSPRPTRSAARRRSTMPAGRSTRPPPSARPHSSSSAAGWRRARAISPTRARACATGWRRCCRMRAATAWRSPSSRCTRCMPPTAAASARWARPTTCATTSARASASPSTSITSGGTRSLEQEIRRAGSRILGFHTCDWRVPTRDLLVDRAMMGDGVIDIPLIRGWVEAAGYDGFCEVEIFSEADWWRRPAEEVVAACIARHQSHV
jgi:hypothetical protein